MPHSVDQLGRQPNGIEGHILGPLLGRQGADDGSVSVRSEQGRTKISEPGVLKRDTVRGIRLGDNVSVEGSGLKHHPGR
jgi:hypothetical protein